MSKEIMTEALAAAKKAGEDMFFGQMGGVDRYACGFAWVTVTPHHKGNTGEGKAERKVLREMGFELDWTGKAFQFWNPSGLGCQNVDCKEAGARAAAKVLREHGFKAYAGSRLD